MSDTSYSLDPHLSLPGLIGAEIKPETALLAGAPDGALAGKLAFLGVETWQLQPVGGSQLGRGVRIMEGSLDSPFGRHFDLLIVLDGLLGLATEDLERVVANITAHSTQILVDLGPLGARKARGEPLEKALGPLVACLSAREYHLDPDFDRLKTAPGAFLFRQKAVPWREIATEYEIRVITFSFEHAEYKTEIRALKGDWKRLRDGTFFKLLSRYSAFEKRLFPDSTPITDLANRLITFSVKAYRWLRTRLGNLYRRMRRLPIARPLASFDEEYQRWITENTPDMNALDLLRAKAETFENRPMVSFITPVFNPPAAVLADTIESVLAQVYPNWELCLVDGGDDPRVRALLQDYSQRDDRIRVSILGENLGISGNSNAALHMARGEFIAILDHDDVLASDMLFEVVRRLNEKPETDVIYFDEDKLSADGSRRKDPFFKPGWSPEMLLSANYLTHAVYRRALLEEVGPFDPQTDGAQDWDLALRVAERTGAVEHIPRILYHWRQIGGSTAGEFRAKDWVFETQKKTVLDHLARRGLPQAEAEFDRPGSLRLRWPHSGRRVSIIIPTKDKLDYLRRTLGSIFEMTRYPDYEIVLVDNQSEEAETYAYYEQLRSDVRVRFVDFDETFNYSRANNLGAAVASGDFLLFLNNDMEIIEPDWLDELVRWAELPDIGAVGTKLLFPDGRIQHAGVVLGMEGHASHVFYGAHEHHGGIFGSVDWYRNFMAVTGACALIPRQVFEQVGGFDEKYVLAFSDIEICLRIHQAGYRVVYTPFAPIRHFEGQSRGSHIPLEDIRTGVGDFLPWVRQGDPYFNPNLSHTFRMPALAAPTEADPVARLEKMAA